jgi:hypothetical protein
MSISTIEVSSVVLGPKKLEIRKTNREKYIRAVSLDAVLH